MARWIIVVVALLAIVAIGSVREIDMVKGIGADAFDAGKVSGSLSDVEKALGIIHEQVGTLINSREQPFAPGVVPPQLVFFSAEEVSGMVELLLGYGQTPEEVAAYIIERAV